MTTTDTNVLAVVTGKETSSHVLEAAIEYAEQHDSSLVVLHVMLESVYEMRQQAVMGSRDLRNDGFTFTTGQARDSARSIADRAAQATVGNREIQYTPVGEVGGLVSTVLAVAADHDCDTIFVPDPESWFQRVIRRPNHKLAKLFNGTVVRVPLPSPSNLKTERMQPKA